LKNQKNALFFEENAKEMRQGSSKAAVLVVLCASLAIIAIAAIVVSSQTESDAIELSTKVREKKRGEKRGGRERKRDKCFLYLKTIMPTDD
jgi:hypothetical protein